jgi:threonine synthase
VPDWIVIPVVPVQHQRTRQRVALVKELGQNIQLPRLVAAQAERANPFYLSYLTGSRAWSIVRKRRWRAPFRSAIR